MKSKCKIMLAYFFIYYINGIVDFSSLKPAIPRLLPPIPEENNDLRYGFDDLQNNQHSGETNHLPIGSDNKIMSYAIENIFLLFSSILINKVIHNHVVIQLHDFLLISSFRRHFCRISSIQEKSPIDCYIHRFL